MKKKTNYVVYIYCNNDLERTIFTLSPKVAWMRAYSIVRSHYGDYSFDIVNYNTGETLLSGYFLTQHMPYGVTHIALCLHEFSRQREFVVSARTLAALGY